MGAEFFSVEPRPTQDVETTMGTCLRKVHRWVSIAFALTVAANFTALLWGEPPAWITYSPLPPLLILLGTGLYMLGRHYARARQAFIPVRSKG